MRRASLPIKVVVEGIHPVVLVVFFQPLFDWLMFAKSEVLMALDVVGVLGRGHVGASVLNTQVIPRLHELVEMLQNGQHINVAVFHYKPRVGEVLHWDKRQRTGSQTNVLRAWLEYISQEKRKRLSKIEVLETVIAEGRLGLH